MKTADILKSKKDFNDFIINIYKNKIDKSRITKNGIYLYFNNTYDFISYEYLEMKVEYLAMKLKETNNYIYNSSSLYNNSSSLKKVL